MSEATSKAVDELFQGFVDELPKKASGGGGRESKYVEVALRLADTPGKIAKLGPFKRSAASGAVKKLRELGVDAQSRADGDDIYIYASVDGNAAADESDIFEHAKTGA